MKAIAAETFVHNYVVEYSFIKASRSLILLSICIGSFLWWSVFSKTSITAIYMFGYNGIYICIYNIYIYTDFAVVGQNSERPRKMFNPLAPIKHDWLGNLIQ